MEEVSLSKIFSGLNDEQGRAVKATEGPVLILAGAGSGKTKCLTHRLAYIVALEKAKLSEILAITFTNKAAQELGERILKILGYPMDSFDRNPVLAMRRTLPWVGTFHSVCVRLLRLEADNIGLSPNFTIFDTDDSLSLVKSILKEKNLDPKQYSPQAILGIIDNAKNELMTPDQYEPYAQGHFQGVALEVYRKYQSRLKELSALDFNDLINETVRMLEKYPEIRKKYHTQFKYVMVDEYQDTNHSQYKLTHLLVNEKTNNLCVVGDDFQSIYSWRGANFQNILNFTRDFPDAEVFKLEENYRSTKNILAGAGSIIKRVKKKSEKNLWTRNEEGAPITVFEANNGYNEADLIITEIKALRSLGNDWNDFAVLYRVNAQSRVMEEVFLAEGVPYRLVGALRFYDRKEIKDLMAYLRFIINHDDTHSLSRIINTPPRGIGPKTFERGGEKVVAFLDLMQEVREHLNIKKPSEILEELIQKIGFRDFLKDGTTEGDSRWENVEELINLSAEYDDLHSFLEHVALVTDTDSYDSNADAVTLMTLHSSKGLEFNTVFIAGFEEGLCPHSRSFEDESEMDEERRLCYVGMTRARKRLYLTYARERFVHGSLTSAQPSRFISELDDSIIDRV